MTEPMPGRTLSLVGARVKFRDDHECYAGMTGTVVAILALPGMEPHADIQLDNVAARADEIEPYSDVENGSHAGPNALTAQERADLDACDQDD